MGDAPHKTPVRHSLGLLLWLPALSLASCASIPELVEGDRGPHRLVHVRDSLPRDIGTEGWTSDWIGGSWTFNQVLPSWNVDLPEGAAFRVDIRTGSSVGPGETPWMDIGGWGPWPEEERSAAECAAGKVAIDILRLADVHDRVQLRFRTQGLATGQHVTLRHLSVNLSQWWEPQTEWEIAGRVAPVEVSVPQRRQTDEAPHLAPRICSPTSVAMVLEYLGVDEPTARVAELLYDAENDIYGNWNRATQGASLLGVDGTLRRINHWEEAASLLADGLPLIISIVAKPGALIGAPYESTGGHLLVLCGLDGRGGAIVMDPAVPPGDMGTRTYSMKELEVCWLRRGGYTYVLGPRD